MTYERVVVTGYGAVTPLGNNVPEFWDGVFDSIPPWINEVAAVMLIMFGAVSFMSLLDVSSSATLARAWANALTQLFGYGAVLVCIGIFALVSAAMALHATYLLVTGDKALNRLYGPKEAVEEVKEELEDLARR